MKLGDRICKHCLGRGKVRERISINLPEVKYYNYIDCKYCEGTGIISWAAELKYGFDKKYLKKRIEEDNRWFHRT